MAVDRRFYEIKKGDQFICTASSEHAFMDEKGKILRLKRAVPELSQKIELLCEHNENPEKGKNTDRRGE